MITRGRIRLISILVVGFALVLIGRLYFVQIVQGADFSLRANEQYMRPVSGLYDRGTIYFQDKSGTLIPAADLASGYTVAIDPNVITAGTTSPLTLYQKLSAILPLNQQTFLADATKPNDIYEEIAKRVPKNEADAVSALKLPGVGIYQDRWRYYPEGSLASQVVGFVGYSGTSTTGLYGLEKYYNNVLSRGNAGMYINPFAQIFSNIQNAVSGNQEGDIVTTIDPNVQQYMEQQLQAVQAKYHSVITGGIIINPETGVIYAMGATPSFNPNTYASVSDIAVYKNPLVENVYEMGSIIKALTMAAGLDTGLVTPTTTYNDKGFLKVDGATIWNYDHRGRGPQTTMQTVLDQSLNTGAATVALELGHQTFEKYMDGFGLASSTGIDLPNEGTNLLRTLVSPKNIDLATAAFGQGIAMTPISTVRAWSALANGGTLITPHVVSQIRYTNGTVKNISYGPGPRVIATSTAAAIAQMLTHVYQVALVNDGVGAVKFAHYSVASKDGTAQIAIPGGGYLPNQYLNSFCGFFPSVGSHARFLVFLYTYEPQGVEFASQSLTPAFVNIVKYLISYYDVPPDR